VQSRTGWKFIGTAVMALTAVAAASTRVIATEGTANSPAAIDHTRRPNVLLVTIDTMRADHSSSYGYQRLTTPEIDRLAREGVLFENAYTATPTTGPAHATLFTSTYPLGHGVLKNGYVLGEEHTTLAEVLNHAGYQTAALPSSFVLTRRFGFAQGFDHFDDDFSDADASVSAKTWQGIPVEGKFDRRASETTERAITWLEQRGKERPFFLWVHYFDPHAPYDPPDGYRQQIVKRAAENDPADKASNEEKRLAEKILDYDAEIRFADEQVGRLVQHLDRTLGREKTIIVITTDHGEGLMQHGWMTHGLDLYEELVRVVLIIRWPGHVPTGGRLAGAVALIDITPTLLALLDLAPGDLIAEGIDLSPAALERGPVPADRPLYFQRRPYGKAARTRHETELPMFGIRRGTWKYIEAGPLAQLFELGADPGETNNLKDQRRDRATSMALELKRWRDQSADQSVPPQTISDKDRARLRALGYVD
jgi:arylsulfatase A-like enzyme